MNLSEKEKVSSSVSSAAPTSRVTKELLNKKPNNEAKSVKSPSFRWLKAAAKPYASGYCLNACSSPRWFYKHEGDSDENNSFIKGYN